MAIQVNRPDDNPTAGAVKTPAPDNISRPKEGGNGYGQMNDLTPSSIAPGERLPSQLATNLESSVSDEALGRVIGGEHMPNLQTRDVTGNVPDHPNMGAPDNSRRVPARPAREGDPLNLKSAMGFEK